ncbi:MAG: hypothetical protein QF664_05040 [Dehalococcoidia bacterium]|jgi:hypothetical protein|nr:hypothetical protein [Dehalococcoidia bacterium]
MIVARRAIAVVLVAFLVVAFGACITVDRIAGAALDRGYLKDELSGIELYAFVDQEVIPHAVEEWLEEQADWRPDNFGEADFPADATAQRVLADLVRQIFPPEYTRALAEHAIDEFIPYLAGDTDSFELRLNLGERVDVALGRDGGPSPVEAAFRELDLGRVMIEGAYQSFEDQAVTAAQSAGIEAAAARAELRSRSPDLAVAAAWFTDQLFDSVDALLPYLLGEVSTFEVTIDFAEQPELAAILALLLQQTPEALASSGFVYSDVDLNRALRDQGAGAEDELARGLEWLQRDFVYTSDDFLEDLAEDGGSAADFDDVRGRAGLVRGALRWTSIIIVAGLVLSVGALGGRSWPSRLIWGAGALFAVSSFWFLVAGPVYDQFAEPEIHDGLVEATEDWSESFESVRLSYVERVETVVNDLAGGFASSALRVALASALAVAAGVAWPYFARREERRAGGVGGVGGSGGGTSGGQPSLE